MRQSPQIASRSSQAQRYATELAREQGSRLVSDASSYKNKRGHDQAPEAGERLKTDTNVGSHHRNAQATSRESQGTQLVNASGCMHVPRRTRIIPYAKP